jgi:hypothetical protein
VPRFGEFDVTVEIGAIPAQPSTLPLLQPSVKDSLARFSRFLSVSARAGCAGAAALCFLLVSHAHPSFSAPLPSLHGRTVRPLPAKHRHYVCCAVLTRVTLFFLPLLLLQSCCAELFRPLKKEPKEQKRGKKGKNKKGKKGKNLPCTRLEPWTQPVHNPSLTLEPQVEKPAPRLGALEKSPFCHIMPR